MEALSYWITNVYMVPHLHVVTKPKVPLILRFLIIEKICSLSSEQYSSFSLQRRIWCMILFSAANMKVKARLQAPIIDNCDFILWSIKVLITAHNTHIIYVHIYIYVHIQTLANTYVVHIHNIYRNTHVYSLKYIYPAAQ